MTQVIRIKCYDDDEPGRYILAVEWNGEEKVVLAGYTIHLENALLIGSYLVVPNQDSIAMPLEAGELIVNPEGYRRYVIERIAQDAIGTIYQVSGFERSKGHRLTGQG